MTVSLGLGAAPAAAGERILVAEPEARGFSSEAVDKLRIDLLAQLRTAGAEVIAGELAQSVTRACLQDPACVRDAAGRVAASGVLESSLIRFGPTVQVELRFLDGRSGEEALLLSSSIAVDALQGSEQLAADLQRGVQALAQLHGNADETQDPASTQHADTTAPPVIDDETLTPEADGWLGPWTLAGGGGLALACTVLVAGAITGSLAALESQELAQNCPQGSCPPSEAERLDRMQALAMGTDILLGSGAALGVVGAALIGVGIMAPAQ